MKLPTHLPIAGGNENYNAPGEWPLPVGYGGMVVRYDLPQELVTPHQYFSYAYNKDRIGYNNKMIIGFAPGGNVTGWLTGVPQQKSIEFTQNMVTTLRIQQGSDVCPNPYPNGKITEISDEAWLKKHGMPEKWQEKNNNITLGPDIRLNKLAIFGNEL